MNLEKENYEALKTMLNASDQENLVVAMECIENADFKSNLVYILFLIKESNVRSDLWNKHAPKTVMTFEKVFSVGIPSASISFSNIMRKLQLYEATQEHYQFFADKYAEHLLETFNGVHENPGIEEIVITIKKKSHESRTISQSIEGPDA